jgi:hypothetical protein
MCAMVGGCGPAFSPSKWRCGIRVQRRLPGGGQHAQLANSVRSLASSWALSAWDIAAVTGLDASLKERSAIVWAKICELLPAVLSTFSGHANRLSPPTSRQPAQTSSRGRANHHCSTSWNHWNRAHRRLTICTFSQTHAK